jgi:hypothetical protein
MAIRSPVGSKLTPYKLSDEELLYIGRIIRATAEIEDIVNWYLFHLSNIPYAILAVLLGKMPVSSRIGLAKRFANWRGGEAKAFYDNVMGSNAVRDLFNYRNILAHGVLLGKTDAGDIAFQVQDSSSEPQEEHVPLLVTAVPPSSLKETAELSEGLIPVLERSLQLEGRQGERLERGLERHPKGQPEPKPKHPRPPQS